MFDAYYEYGLHILKRIELEELEEAIQQRWEKVAECRGARAKRLMHRRYKDGPHQCSPHLLHGVIRANEKAATREQNRHANCEMLAEAADTMDGVYDPVLRDGFGYLWGDSSPDADVYEGGASYISSAHADDHLDEWDEPLEIEEYIEENDFLSRHLAI